MVYKCLRKITHSYAKGIKECLNKGVQYFLLPDEIFTLGKPLLYNILEFKAIIRPKEDINDTESDAKHFMIDNELSSTDMS